MHVHEIKSLHHLLGNSVSVTGLSVLCLGLGVGWKLGLLKHHAGGRKIVLLYIELPCKRIWGWAMMLHPTMYFVYAQRFQNLIYLHERVEIFMKQFVNKYR